MKYQHHKINVIIGLLDPFKCHEGPVNPSDFTLYYVLAQLGYLVLVCWVKLGRAGHCTLPHRAGRS